MKTNIDSQELLKEAKESGIGVIEEKFEYYLIRYLNAKYKEYSNSFDAGEWFIKDVIDKIEDTRIPNKYQFIRAIRLSMKDFNVEKYRKEIKKKDDK